MADIEDGHAAEERGCDDLPPRPLGNGEAGQGGDIWTVRPSALSLLLPLIICCTISLFFFSHSAGAVQTLIDATYPSWPWTQPGVDRAFALARVLSFLPVFWILLQVVLLKITSYTLTSERLIYRNGLLVRKTDEILLSRIRDYRIIRPLPQALVGIGTVRVLSRDETWPRLDLRSVKNPQGIQGSLRETMRAHMISSGYREFEST